MKLQLIFEDEPGVETGMELEVADQAEATATVKDFLDHGWSGEQFIARLIDGADVYEEDQSELGYGGPFIAEHRVGPWVKK